MKNKFEYILLSILLGTSVLLGLSFWLNINFGFNLFYAKHWEELAKLQASHVPITPGFYISIVIAVLIFITGIFVIYKAENNRTKVAPTVIQQKKDTKDVINTIHIQKTDTKTESGSDEPTTTVPEIQLSRPPRLNLPTNMAQIAAQRQQAIQEEKTFTQPTIQQNPYTSEIVQIFSDAGYTIKKNPTISGFTPDLFAIAPNEVLYIGAVDAKMDNMQRAVEKLNSVFTETLEDIQIQITPFILDTINQYQSNDSMMIFKSVDELKQFISKNQIDTISENDVENFEAYSEYIDTIIQYIKNI